VPKRLPSNPFWPSPILWIFSEVSAYFAQAIEDLTIPTIATQRAEGRLDRFRNSLEATLERVPTALQIRAKNMSYITTKHGLQIYYKDWGNGQPIVFSHGWPLSADDWDPQMLFFLSKGYRVIAHDRRGHGRSTQDGLEGSGADWLERFKPYIDDGKTIVVAPHRVFGPETNDLVLQLRKRKISDVILGGMLANMCVESHLRELIEQGFEVAVVKDATAAPKHPEWGYGYTAALINYAFLAHAVLTTDEAVKAIEQKH
jgi:nicotinamidase-related amidase